MTSFQIKLIALVTMAIDHIGMFFFPHVLIFNLIGRLSFPLFAWMIASGAKYSRNLNQYLVRLLALAAISEIPFLAANRLIDPHFCVLNAVFTLSLGLLAILCIKKTKRVSLWALITIVAGTLAYFLKTDYGAAGVFSIVAFYLFYGKIRETVASQLIIYWSFFFIPTILQISLTHIIAPQSAQSLIELVAPASVLFIAMYNGTQGPKAKYLFYLFYPLQYVVFYLVLNIVGVAR
jgi:hypothetical protein